MSRASPDTIRRASSSYSTKPVLICLLKGGQTPGMRKIEDLKTGRDETIATVLGKQEQSILTEIGKKLLAKC